MTTLRAPAGCLESWCPPRAHASDHSGLTSAWALRRARWEARRAATPPGLATARWDAARRSNAAAHAARFLAPRAMRSAAVLSRRSFAAAALVRCLPTTKARAPTARALVTTARSALASTAAALEARAPATRTMAAARRSLASAIAARRVCVATRRRAAACACRAAAVASSLRLHAASRRLSAAGGLRGVSTSARLTTMTVGEAVEEASAPYLARSATSRADSAVTSRSKSFALASAVAGSVPSACALDLATTAAALAQTRSALAWTASRWAWRFSDALAIESAWALAFHSAFTLLSLRMWKTRSALEAGEEEEGQLWEARWRLGEEDEGEGHPPVGRPARGSPRRRR